MILVIAPLTATWTEVLLPQLPFKNEQYAQATDALSGNSLLQSIEANVALSNWARVDNWSLLAFVLGRFLIGFWAGRTGLLQDLERHRRLVRRIFIWSAVLGVGLTVAYRSDEVRMLLNAVDDAVGGFGTSIVFRATALALGIAYAIGFVLLFQVRPFQRALRVFVPVGRMALTNYLAQSLIGVFVFYVSV